VKYEGVSESFPQYIKSWCFFEHFEFRQALGLVLFSTASRPDVVPIQPPTEWVLGALSLGVKLPGHEADHSPPSSAEVSS
jgi:hypothetical protein